MIVTDKNVYLYNGTLQLQAYTKPKEMGTNNFSDSSTDTRNVNHSMGNRPFVSYRYYICKQTS